MGTPLRRGTYAPDPVIDVEAREVRAAAPLPAPPRAPCGSTPRAIAHSYRNTDAGTNSTTTD